MNYRKIGENNAVNPFVWKSQNFLLEYKLFYGVLSTSQKDWTEDFELKILTLVILGCV